MLKILELFRDLIRPCNYELERTFRLTTNVRSSGSCLPCIKNDEGEIIWQAEEPSGEWQTINVFYLSLWPHRLEFGTGLKLQAGYMELDDLAVRENDIYENETTVTECPNCWEMPDFDDCPVCNGTRKIERRGVWVDGDMESGDVPDWVEGNSSVLNKEMEKND